MKQAPLASLPPPPLRVVFLGTPAFAATTLAALIGSQDRVVGVFARPDAPRGRGLALAAPPTKELAARHGIPVCQPTRWKDGSAVAELAALAPDLVVVAAYGRLLPQAALDVPRFGCINVHASLLPRWRGADPISRAILAGDAETGVTIMQMILEMDAGAILWQKHTDISPEDTGETLEARLAELGAAALGEALAAWRDGELVATEQDPSRVTFAPPVVKEAGRIDWRSPAATLERAVRAYDPWPGVSTSHGGRPLKVWRARVEPLPSGTWPPGVVVGIDGEGPLVATGDGGLRLLEVQAAGKRRMIAAEWLRGARIRAQDHFEG